MNWSEMLCGNTTAWMGRVDSWQWTVKLRSWSRTRNSDPVDVATRLSAPSHATERDVMTPSNFTCCSGWKVRPSWLARTVTVPSPPPQTRVASRSWSTEMVYTPPAHTSTMDCTTLFFMSTVLTSPEVV